MVQTCIYTIQINACPLPVHPSLEWPVGEKIIESKNR